RRDPTAWKRLLRERVINGSPREVAGLFGGCEGEITQGSRRAAFFRALPRKEEKGSIIYKWPSERHAVMVPLKVRMFGSEEEARFKVVVTDEYDGSSVKLIVAVARVFLHDRAAITSVHGAVGMCSRCKFLQGVGIGIIVRHVPEGSEIGRAVKHVV